MEQHDVEIEIDRTGRVKVTVKGAKGKACLEYAKLVERIVGREESRELTSEFYEPDGRVSLEQRIEERRG